ncbi:MAG TPA: GAF domain-containing protein [Chloroflexota bacterium]|nr:GAF domain-containing protein [Chloroflexota bacterium]HZU05603.1 GAF domain-containing protein [Chloroflexota bacterium]
MTEDAADALTPEALTARLRQAEATILAQAREIAELRDQLADATFAEELRQALVRMGAAGQLTAPVAHNELLDLIVRTAAHVLGAQAASLFLIDHETNELVFEVALGESAAEARRFRVPLGEGIAGWVAATGQPVAVSDASQDPRFAAAIARSIGYIPRSVLCIPLRSGEAIIGVVELFDKANGQPFTAADMELLGQFASQAAVAIEQSRIVRDLTQLFSAVLQGLLPGGSEEEALRRALETHAAAFTERTVQSEWYRETLQITHLVSEISRHGPEARHLCQQILASVAAYVRSQASQNAAGGWLR